MQPVTEFIKNMLNKFFITALLSILFITSSLLAANNGGDGLDEVNQHRIRRGLRPLIRDRILTDAAKYCCVYRADNRMPKHVNQHVSYWHKNGRLIRASDFYFLPDWYIYHYPNTSAGCGAWELGLLTTEGDTWGTCCKYDYNITYGGAWYEIRGKYRYMHLYVR